MSMNSTLIKETARCLVGDLAQGCDDGLGSGSMTISYYDTAWVAMVSKPEGERRNWLFPECYESLMSAQLPTGGWCTAGPEIDGILTTLAALLTMKTRLRETPGEIQETASCLHSRINRAVQYLVEVLTRWQVEECRHVGFEILVPALLSYLENEGETFDFPGKPALMALYHKKLARFKPELLYSRFQSTLLHSLEAFVGRIDFDQVRHHKIHDSLLASPSSTAAYLMNCSAWDDDAERYLRTAIKCGSGKGTGGVPSAFPSTNFEILWVMSTLLANGFSSSTLGSTDVAAITTYLEEQLLRGDGLVGFAPHLLVDADDTAKAILTLALCGKPFSMSPMIEKFKNGKHFRTYAAERNPSLSANCNVLNALLHSPTPNVHEAYISKALDYLCNSWWTGDIHDKWNLSPLYSMMLLVEAFTKLLELWDQGEVTVMNDLLPFTLLQITIRTLHSQNSDGSWGTKGTCEETAYGILILSKVANLPWVSLNCRVEAAIIMGRLYLDEHSTEWHQPAYLWIEKVTYGSALLSKAYCLAAMKTKISLHQWSDRVKGLAPVNTARIDRFSRFFSSLPIFSVLRLWELQLSIVEGYLCIPRLKGIQFEVFSRRTGAELKYLDYIPFTWTTCNNAKGGIFAPDLLWEMMVISMLNFQADECMETLIAACAVEDLQSIKDEIIQVCQNEECGMTAAPMAEDQNLANSHTERNVQAQDSKQYSRQDSDSCSPANISNTTLGSSHSKSACTESPFHAFVTRFKTHPAVVRASSNDRSALLHEIESYLLAQLAQCIGNRFRNTAAGGTPLPKTNAYRPTPETFYAWVRGTAADHISCPYTVAYFTCLIAPRTGEDAFTSARAKFFAQDLARHLASMCRMYNDYGSVERDRAERNLNSIDFPEFGACADAENGLAVGTKEGQENEAKLNEEVKKKKGELLSIAEYERECLGLAMRRLEEVVPASTMRRLEVFVDVTDLFGQIYVARDIGVRTA